MYKLKLKKNYIIIYLDISLYKIENNFYNDYDNINFNIKWL